MKRLLAGLMMLGLASPAAATVLPGDVELVDYKGPPSLADQVEAGDLPPVAERLPINPAIVPVAALGQHGGTMRLLFGRAKDIRLMVVYGYSRLVGYDQDFELAPDILESVDVVEGREFTLRLRDGHKWSDGHPFTTEDFRYYWEDMINHPDMSHIATPRVLLVDGQKPEVEIIDALTVRYTWQKPNPFFLPALAGPRPLYIYKPAHYLKAYHPNHQDPAVLAQKIETEEQRNWVALHYKYDRPYRNANLEMPTLQPWVNTTPSPAERFTFKRNPFFHRVDPAGLQLPYVDEVTVTIASPRLIPAKTGTGEADLQARALSFNNYTFLKQGEKRNDFNVRLWKDGKGAKVALYPNLTASDPVWREVLRNENVRRAMSIAINRREINQVIYYGLARECNNTILTESPLYQDAYSWSWTQFDLEEANRMLDAEGLDQRNDRGIRLLPDGRPMEIIVETAGESSEQADVLELVHDSWLAAGIKIHTKPLQREVFRNRIFAGSTLMSVWSGFENGIPSDTTPPTELAPTSQQQLHWPKWGQYFDTSGKAGEPIDYGPAKDLYKLYEEWLEQEDAQGRRETWRKMLEINADKVFSFGIVCSVPQPVAVANTLNNVPEEGLYNWITGAHFGVYRPDTFWFSPTAEVSAR